MILTLHLHRHHKWITILMMLLILLLFLFLRTLCLLIKVFFWKLLEINLWVHFWFWFCFRFQYFIHYFCVICESLERICATIDLIHGFLILNVYLSSLWTRTLFAVFPSRNKKFLIISLIKCLILSKYFLIIHICFFNTKSI